MKNVVQRSAPAEVLLVLAVLVRAADRSTLGDQVRARKLRMSGRFADIVGPDEDGNVSFIRFATWTYPDGSARESRNEKSIADGVFTMRAFERDKETGERVRECTSRHQKVLAPPPTAEP
jgi:hypothetical protein